MTESVGGTPLVSVVMSVYNDEPFLGHSLDSLFAQRGVDFEVIVVDDGSSDGSASILDAYAARDSRLRVVHRENQGLTAALRFGCSLARGKYIARQDADDMAFPDRLRRLAAVLNEDPGIVLVTSATVMMGAAGELLTRDRRTASAQEQDTSCHGSWMFRRAAYESLGGYRTAFRAAQDVDLRLRFAEVGEVRVLPDVLYAFRVRDESISARSPVQKRLSRLASEAARVRAQGLDDADVIAEAARMSAGADGRRRREPGSGDYFVGRCLVALRDRRAVAYLWRACRRQPLAWRAWLALGQALALTRDGRGFDISSSGIRARGPG